MPTREEVEVDHPELSENRGPAAYIAEFIGTFALVFFITVAFSLYVVDDPAAFIDFSVIGLVHVFALFALVQVLAVASGAHFNPAVTLAVAALRQIKPGQAVTYMIVQLLGAVAGARLTKSLLVDEGEPANYGAPAVSDRLDGAVLPGMVVEGIGTFFLMFVIVGVAGNPRAARGWAAFAIGATLGLLVMLFAPLTGAGFNPARSFGPALVSGEFGDASDFLLVYVVAPAIGAVVAAFVCFRLAVAPRKRSEERLGPLG